MTACEFGPAAHESDVTSTHNSVQQVIAEMQVYANKVNNSPECKSMARSPGHGGTSYSPGLEQAHLPRIYDNSSTHYRYKSLSQSTSQRDEIIEQAKLVNHDQFSADFTVTVDNNCETNTAYPADDHSEETLCNSFVQLDTQIGSLSNIVESNTNGNSNQWAETTASSLRHMMVMPRTFNDLIERNDVAELGQNSRPNLRSDSTASSLTHRPMEEMPGTFNKRAIKCKCKCSPIRFLFMWYCHKVYPWSWNCSIVGFLSILAGVVCIGVIGRY